MNDVFWLEPGAIAGRAGPNRKPWNLAEVRALGIDSVLTVNEGEGCVEEEFAANGLRHAIVALPPHEPPRPGDEQACLEQLPRALAFLRAERAAGRVVLVHCSSGKDRTGLLMCAWLMRERGLALDEAIARVRRVRPIALSAIGWEAMGRRVLAALA